MKKTGSTPKRRPRDGYCRSGIAFTAAALTPQVHRPVDRVGMRRMELGGLGEVRQGTVQGVDVQVAETIRERLTRQAVVESGRESMELHAAFDQLVDRGEESEPSSPS